MEVLLPRFTFLSLIELALPYNFLIFRDPQDSVVPQVNQVKKDQW